MRSKKNIYEKVPEKCLKSGNERDIKERIEGTRFREEWSERRTTITGEYISVREDNGKGAACN